MSNTVTLERPEIVYTEIAVKSTAPLICHQWSEKAKREILDKQMKKASKGKAVRNPEQEYQDSLYKLDDGKYGFPSTGFKKAMIRAGTYADMKMTYLRGAFHIICTFTNCTRQPGNERQTAQPGVSRPCRF